MMTLAFLSEFFQWLSKPWMPADGGGFTENVDALNGFILAVSYFFTAIIGGLMIYFAIKYRQTDKAEVGQGITHSTPIEIIWTLPPLVIVLVIFAVGFTGYMDMSTTPKAGNAYEIRAEAYRWGWNFYYPNGGQSTNLYIPADRPVKLTLESKDVLHSLFVPAMRAKKDVVPGRFNTMWFEPDPTLVTADKPEKKFILNCTEYCGQGHSQMNAECIIVHESKWDEVLEKINIWNPEGKTPVALGEDLYKNRGGCSQCHSVNGDSNTGPTWYNLYNSERQLSVTDGESSVVADDAYINESIRYPNRKKASGYEGQNMSAYPETQLNAGDVRALIEYIKSVSPDSYPQGADLQAFPEGYEGKEELSGAPSDTGDTAPEAAPETAPEAAAETEAAPAQH